MSSIYRASCFGATRDRFPGNAVSIKKVLVREEQWMMGLDYLDLSGGSCKIV